MTLPGDASPQQIFDAFEVRSILPAQNWDKLRIARDSHAARLRVPALLENPVHDQIGISPDG